MTDPGSEVPPAPMPEPAPDHDPADDPAPAAAPETAAPAYLPFGAYAPPSVIAPARPAWTRTYELPSARQVVYAGLQLAQSSNRVIRRASVYIGLLSLGAFGPAAILLLVGIARLLSDPATAATLKSDNPFLVLVDQPELSGPLFLVYAVGIVGIILLVAISIDAEAMAIAILGGVASEQPLSVQQALRRARQTFWRLFASALLVNLTSGLLALAIQWPFLRPFDSNQGVSFIASMIATLVVTPFAFAATGIVLGDAGAIDTLRRSIRLFRARPRVALVVTLFTLVAAAIQTFAFGGGADLLGRVVGFFHVGEGASSLILPGFLVLAFIVAFGSLTFTIAAILAAPQVAAFLGLTFYSGGLDKVREPVAKGKSVRWVSVPMTIAIACLAVATLAGIPSIASFQPRAAGLVLKFLRDAATAHGSLVIPDGPAVVVNDPPGDEGPAKTDAADIVAADVAGLEEIPGWLLDEAFSCTAAGVACGAGADTAIPLEAGGVLFVQRMAAAPSLGVTAPLAEWGPMLSVRDLDPAPAYLGDRFEGANVRFITDLDRGRLRLREYVFGGTTWTQSFSTARSAWRGDLLLTIVPIADLPEEPTGWDAYALVETSQKLSADSIRPASGEIVEISPLLPYIAFVEGGQLAPSSSSRSSSIPR